MFLDLRVLELVNWSSESAQRNFFLP